MGLAESIGFPPQAGVDSAGSQEIASDIVL